MTRKLSTSGRLDELGILLTAALALDRSWAKSAACRPARRVVEVEGEIAHPTPWHVQRQQTVDGISGHELIQYALLICHNCPAQYDCLNYAVKGEMQAGTWGAPTPVVKELQKMNRVDPEEFDALLAVAKDANIPVQAILAMVAVDIDDDET